MRCDIVDRSKAVYKDMKCPDCGNKLKDCNYYERYDSCTDETYGVYTNYHECDCGYIDVSYEAIWGKLMIKSREKKWGKLIMSSISSPEEIEQKFYNKTEVLKLIKNYKGEKIYPDNKTDLIRNLDLWCIHFVLFGRKYYLKNSVEQYLYSRNGLFPIKNGI